MGGLGGPLRSGTVPASESVVTFEKIMMARQAEVRGRQSVFAFTALQLRRTRFALISWPVDAWWARQDSDLQRDRLGQYPTSLGYRVDIIGWSAVV
jgi:hypothetical protein